MLIQHKTTRRHGISHAVFFSYLYENPSAGSTFKRPEGHFADKFGEMYNLVLKANLAAISQARPGMVASELDAVARRMIRKAGYGKRFGHALGHGVGIEIHEYPVASSRSKMVLKPGMLVTIEPGVYIEGELGVRIEDLVLITKDGCEVLSSSPK